MTEQEHELGKAIMGGIAILLVIILAGYALLNDSKNPPLEYFDDVSSIESENLV